MQDTRWTRQLEWHDKAAACAYVEYIERFASTTQAARVRAVKRFYREGNAAGLVDRDPFRRIPTPTVRPPSTPRVLEKDDVTRLLDSTRVKAGRSQKQVRLIRDGALIQLVLALCLKRAEVAALRWNDFRVMDGE